MTSDAPDDKARSAAARVADYRCRVADAFETLTREQSESPSWCSGWRVRDVLGHLVHNAEASRVSMVRDVIRHPIRPDRGLDLSARQLGDQPVPTLAQRLRKAQHGGVRVIGFPAAVGLGDVLVHGNDALRALGLEFGVDPYDAMAVLNAYRRVGGLIFHARPSRNVRLVAPMSSGRTGKVPRWRAEQSTLSCSWPTGCRSSEHSRGRAWRTWPHSGHGSRPMALYQPAVPLWGDTCGETRASVEPNN
jgi:uncharacterized protein (TIGR03083 family)